MLEKLDTPLEKAVLSILWIFGKRRTEICLMDAQNVRWTEEYLFCKFHILKRKRMPKLPEIRIPRSNFASEFIIDYAQEVKAKTPFGPLFQGTSGVRHATIFNKKLGTKYLWTIDLTGRICPEKVSQIVKKADPDLWPHFFRHSRNTELGPKVGGFRLKAFNSWASLATADAYVAETDEQAAEAGDFLA